MQTYFNIRYELDRQKVAEAIDRRVGSGEPGYVCVADGVIVSMVQKDPDYRRVVDGAMFSICDSSFVCGSEIFMDIVRSRRYRMIFMGTSPETLKGLKARLTELNPDVDGMQFVSLPYRDVQDFDYPGIARTIEEDGAQIVWVALGAPKQEIFMSMLRPWLRSGVMIAVGAAFKFYSGTDVKRAPQWMIRCHLEFVHRILKEPRKQLRRCWGIVTSLPVLLLTEMRRKREREKVHASGQDMEEVE